MVKQIIACVISSLFSLVSFADENAVGKKTQDDELAAKSHTKFDFSEANIEGEMKAPQGFYLQGRNQQSMTQMVKLRSHFKNELRNSKSAVKAVCR